MEPTLRSVRLGGLLVLCMTWALPAAAQPIRDHLECYKVKDPQPKARYTADVAGLTAEPGCTIKVPATMVSPSRTPSITSSMGGRRPRAASKPSSTNRLRTKTIWATSSIPVIHE